MIIKDKNGNYLRVGDYVKDYGGRISIIRDFQLNGKIMFAYVDYCDEKKSKAQWFPWSLRKLTEEEMLAYQLEQ